MVIEVLDFEDQPPENIVNGVENTRYSSVHVRYSKMVTVDNFTDNHPLNQNATAVEAFNNLFKDDTN